MKYIVFLVIIIPNILFSQSCINKKGRTFKIVFSELNHTVFPKEKIPFSDTLTKDRITIIIKILNCKGKAKFILYDDRTGKIKAEGSYSSSKALLKRHESEVSLLDGSRSMGVGEFYEGLKDGIWIYNDDKGNLMRNESYKDGVLLNSN